MKSKTMLSAIVLSLTVAMTSLHASAATVTESSRPGSSSGWIIGDFVYSSSNFEILTKSQSGDASPWGSSTTDEFGSVGKNGFLEIGFLSTQTALSLVWGSKDTYNKLTLSNLGSEVATIIPGTDLTQGGSSLVSITNVLFDTIRFETGSINAFEFANLSFTGQQGRETVSNVPLPAAAWLFLSVLGGAGALRRFGVKAR